MASIVGDGGNNSFIAGTNYTDGADTIHGNGGNDTIYSGSSADLVYGGDDNDLIDGGGSGDILYGDAGNDTVYGGTTNATDFIYGGTGNDLLFGYAGGDSLYGGDNNDTLFGGSGGDRLEGGNDFDFVSYSSVTADLTVNLTSGSAIGEGTDTLVGIEGVIGGSGDDSITGSTGDNWLIGGGGADTIDGGSGNDTVEGGTGGDSLVGGLGTDLLSYANSATAVNANLSTGTATGEGTDTISGFENLTGSNLNDTLTGDGGANVIDGGANSDLVRGGAGSDTLIGGTGTGADTLYGGIGNDSIDAGAGTDLVYGGSGADSVNAGTEADTVFGGTGNDTIDGGTGADVIYGGPETGTTSTAAPTGLQFNWSDYADEQDLAGGVVQDTGGINVTVSYNGGFPGASFSAERTGSTSGVERDYPIYVGPGEPFASNSSAELFRPADGFGSTSSSLQFDFAAVGGSGYSSEVENLRFRISDIDTGNFIDSVTVRAYDAEGNEIPVTITLGSGGALSQSGNTVTATGGGVNPNAQSGSVLYQVAGPVARIVIQYTDLDNAQQAIFVSDLHFDAVALTDDDSIIGGDGNDTLFGGIGHDSLLGDIGDDLFYGGIGHDTIEAGDGNDISYGDAGDDTIRFGAGNDTVYGGDGNDRIDDAFSISLTGNNLLYGGTGNDTLWAGDDADTLYGDEGTDLLNGEAGNDLLYGGADNDDLFGGTDHDTLHGDAGDDTLSGESGNDVAYGGTGNDALNGGVGLDTLYGDAGNDTLYGDAGDDLLSGGTGNDLVYGGTGNDMIYGGAGTDSIFAGDDGDQIFMAYTKPGDETDAGNAVANDVLGSESVDGGGDDGPTDNDTLTVDITGMGWTRIDLVYDPLDHENGTIRFFDASGVQIGILSFTEIENLVIVCFTPGTQILTGRGEVPVEALVPGDLVVTRDNGLQPLRWVGTRKLTYAELRAKPDLQPVRIAAGALAGVGPDRAMLVSPQHRVLVEGARAEMYFGESEVLVPAKHLIGLAEVTRALPAEGVTYVHILFDRHEIVQSDGIWTESFQPAERTLNALDDAARAEVLELFPDLAADATGFPAARLSLKAHEAKVLVSG